MGCNKSGWTDDRLKYYNGKVAAREISIPLLEEQRNKLLNCIKRDTAWLASLRLMDYSLLVAIKESAPAGTSASGEGGALTANRPILAPNGKAIHTSIIDFLQKWTSGK